VGENAAVPDPSDPDGLSALQRREGREDRGPLHVPGEASGGEAEREAGTPAGPPVSAEDPAPARPGMSPALEDEVVELLARMLWADVQASRKAAAKPDDSISAQ
jgi:hypothetical protein